MKEPKNNPEAEKKANALGFNIGDTVGHKNNKFFTGNIISFCYNYKQEVYLTIEYGVDKFTDSYDLRSFNKLNLC